MSPIDYCRVPRYLTSFMIIGACRKVICGLAFIYTSLCSSQILPFRNYTMKEGLPSNVVLALCQDSRGFLWIGTDEGLSIYDGASFTNYTVANGLPHSRLEAILESKKHPGTMWIATHGGGIVRMVDRKFETISLGPDPLENTVDMVYEDTGGVLWCVNHRGLTKVVKDSPVTLLSMDRGSGGKLAVGTDGLLWVGIENRVFAYQGNNLLCSYTLDVPKKALISAMCSDSNGIVWVGTEYGYLFRVDRHGVRAKYRPFGLSFTFLLDDGNSLLAGVWETGIIRIPKDAVPEGAHPIMDESNGLPENRIGVAIRDREGTLWLGGLSKGLTKLAEENVFRFVTPAMRSARGCMTDASGHLWVLNDSGFMEIWRDRRNRWQQHQHSPMNLRGTKYMACADVAGNMWVGFYDRRIVSLEISPSVNGPSTLRTRTVLEPDIQVPKGDPLLFMVDRRHRLWYVSHAGYLAVFDVARRPALLRVFRVGDGFPIHSARALYEDRDGNIWCGTFNAGLSVLPRGDLSKGEFQLFTTEHGLPNNSVRSIYQDRHGTLWVGTRHGGVAFIGGNGSDPLTALRNGEKFNTYSIRVGLLSNAVWDIAEHPEGSLLLAMYGGVQTLYPGRIPPLRTNRSLLGLNILACGFFRSDFFWASTPDLLVVYDLTRAQVDTIPPPVYLRRFIVNGQEIPESRTREFSYTENTCTIEFIGLSLRDERAVQYEYRLLDQDTTWHGPITARSVTFARLSPGTYTFEVRARNSEGIASALPARTTFTILAPFWQRWWFYAIAALVLISATALAVWTKAKRLLAIERIRTRIATDLHDDIGADLTQIAILSEVLKARIDGGQHLATLEKIGSTARRIIDGMSDLIWYIEPRNDTVKGMVDRIQEFAGDLLQAREIALSVEVHPALSPLRLTPELRRELFLILKEALNNAVRHAQCSSISLKIFEDRNTIVFEVDDNGRGLPEDARQKGHGLTNMSKRVESIGGRFSINTVAGRGTTLRIEIPHTHRFRKPTKFSS